MILWLLKSAKAWGSKNTSKLASGDQLPLKARTRMSAPHGQRQRPSYGAKKNARQFCRAFSLSRKDIAHWLPAPMIAVVGAVLTGDVAAPVAGLIVYSCPPEVNP